MRFIIDLIVYSFFLVWNILLGYITYCIWRYGEFTTQEPRVWLINIEMVLAVVIFAFSVWA